MKKLFGDDWMLNLEGGNIAQSFGKLLDDWIVDQNLSNVNPIELGWIVNNEIGIRMSELYLDAATKID